MLAIPSDLLSELKQPEYTGENRCTPCTILNVAIALVATAIASRLRSRLAGAVTLAISLLAIYLRGYLVPGTPTLTKRYFPDRVLRLFDKEPERLSTGEFTPAPAAGSAGGSGTAAGGAATGSDPDSSGAGMVDVGESDDDEDAAVESDSDPVQADEGAEGEAAAPETQSESDGDSRGGDGGDGDDTAEELDPDSEPVGADPDEVDPERLLLDLGAVEPCEDVDDLCLTDEFADAWLDTADELEGSEMDPEPLARLFRTEPDAIDVRGNEDAPLIKAEGIGHQRWSSSAALLTDLAADATLAERHERWEELGPARRLPILKALRSFLETCPLCGGRIEMGNEEVESCCRSLTVFAVACDDCDERYLEVPADRIAPEAEAEA